MLQQTSFVSLLFSRICLTDRYVDDMISGLIFTYLVTLELIITTLKRLAQSQSSAVFTDCNIAAWVTVCKGAPNHSYNLHNCGKCDARFLIASKLLDWAENCGMCLFMMKICLPHLAWVIQWITTEKITTVSLQWTACNTKSLLSHWQQR